MDPRALTVHIISHNHWDREWIFTSKHTNRWLRPFFDNLFRMLERYPNYRFVLDGQTLMVEDYLAQLPEEEAISKEEEIRRYVREGRLLVGPYYLQPDWTLPSGEALVRNLMIGHKMAERLGGVMKVGWLLDNFGQIAQAPQIHRGFGIEGVFLWRGVGMDPDELRSEFWWEAPDGSRVLAIYLLNTYRNAMALSQIREIAPERVISQAKLLGEFASTPNVLLMNGYEQDPGPDDVLPIIEEVNKRGVRCRQSTPAEYLGAIKEFKPKLPTLRGYLYSGRYMPVLTGVFSSRVHLKQRNAECQRELERWAEPFATLAWVVGALPAYPRVELERAWKALLLNHPHDDICGCHIDDISREMLERFAQARKLAGEVTEESLGSLARLIDTSRGGQQLPGAQKQRALIVFNPSPWRRQEVVGFTLEEFPDANADSESFSIRDGDGRPVPYHLGEGSSSSDSGRRALYLLVDVPPLGWRAYYLARGKADVEPGAHPRVTASAEDRIMENDHLKVKLNEDGSLTITDKETGRVYENLGYFEDGGDAGDTYDYSYPQEDRVITSLGGRAKIALEEAGPLVARFRVELKLPLPKGLTEDRRARSEELVECPIISWVELAAGSPRVDIQTVVYNLAKDHRLRVLFPTALKVDRSWAEEPFDVAEFPLSLEPEPPLEELPERLRGLVIAGRNRVPSRARPFQNFFTVTDGRAGLAVLSDGLAEYELLEDGTLALTLLRCVGWLARDDLLTREGDIGPQILTPEAQLLGRHVVRYSIYPYRGDWLEGRVHLQAEAHNLKLRAVWTPCHPEPGSLPDWMSFLSVESEPPGALKLTAVKRAEEGEGLILILRLYNVTNRAVRGRIRLQAGAEVEIERACRANLNEEEEGELAMDEGTLEVEARPKEILTLRIRCRRGRGPLAPAGPPRGSIHLHLDRRPLWSWKRKSLRSRR